MLCRMAWIFLKMIQWISSDENAVRKSRGKAVRLELKICDGTTQRVFLIFSSSWGYSLLVIHCSGRWRRMEKNNNNVRKEWLLITVNQPTAKARPKRALRCVAIGPPFTTTLHSNSDLDFFFFLFHFLYHLIADFENFVVECASPDIHSTFTTMAVFIRLLERVTVEIN